MKYKLFGKSGLRVSELCLGSMAFGEDTVWGCEASESKKIFEAFANSGGNFVDTANIYGAGESEKILGELVHCERDNFVLATKYSFLVKGTSVNSIGNHRKNLMRSVEQSLLRLNTDVIDILWLHCPDNLTPVEEIMRALDDLIRQGKVHYVGISNAPAWEVARANIIAEFRGWSAFVGIQPEYNLLQRSAERELFPMAKALDIAITPWSPLAGGALTGKYLSNQGKRIDKNSVKFNSTNTAITEKLVQLAQEIGRTPGQVATRWVMQKDQVVIPIIGARKLSQIKEGLQCLDFTLSQDIISQLNDISKIELGYPHDFLKTDMVRKHAFAGLLENVDNHRQ